MAHSIGKTIAELRKAKGWTQVELAEKLGVSDKAVSKWESEGGFPEITQLPVLASIFGVTIDYLMTGKKEELVISLDDMDAKKRLLYLIQKDDVENFIKYKCNDIRIVDSIERGLRKIVISEIIKNQSIKIFNACCDSKNYFVTTMANTAREAIEPFIDELVKLACLAGNVSFLSWIDFRSLLVVDNKALNVTNPLSILFSYEMKKNSAISIKRSTLAFIFTDNRVSDGIIRYICSYDKFNRNTARYNTSAANFGGMESASISYMALDVVKLLYQTKRFELLKEYLKLLSEELDDFNAFLREVGSHTVLKSRGEYFTHNGWGYERIVGKAVVFSKEFIYDIAYNDDKAWVDTFVQHNKKVAFMNIRDFKVYCPSEKELVEIYEKVAKEKRISAIKNDTSISEHERRCKLACEKALSLADAIVADDYDAFVLLDESERNKIDPEYLSKNCVQDVRFYIYAVNVSDNTEYLNQGLKNILENYPERYDIQDVLLSAGAIIDGNVAMTNILKQNVLILNKQVVVENSNIEVNESVTKQELLDKVAGNQLQYVIINATIQMERKLKVHIVEQIDLADMIDKALNMGLIDSFNCKLLHKLRMARNSIMHAGNKSHYTADIVKMWVEAVYSIK